MVLFQAAIVSWVLGAGSANQTVLLEFYADWCGPCRAMAPTVDALIAAGYPVQRINIDQNRALAAKYQIQSIPCFVMLVDGREVDRVTGGTTFSRLERMCQAAVSKTNAPSAAEHPAAPFVENQAPDRSQVRPSDLERNFPSQTESGTPASPLEARLLAASVRIRVEDKDGHSCGSGTIIDARGGEALVLTCGHVFRDSQGQGRIVVDLFQDGEPRQAPGRLISYDLNRDLGLVAIRPPGPVVTVPLAPPGYRIERGQAVISVGCSHGGPPTLRRSQITSLDKFLGPPNIQVAGQPVDGRSGGGLFSEEGYLIGVCNAADPSDKEGLFAALSSIHAELDRAQLAFIYRNPTTDVAMTNPATTGGNSPTVASAPPMSQADGEAARGLNAHERAALEEIRRRLDEGAEVVCIIRPRNLPQAKSEVIILDRASPEFLERLAEEKRRPPLERRLTSLEQPTQKKLIEWAAPEAPQQPPREERNSLPVAKN